jgi:hypothetical protein
LQEETASGISESMTAEPPFAFFAMRGSGNFRKAKELDRNLLELPSELTRSRDFLPISRSLVPRYPSPDSRAQAFVKPTSTMGKQALI